MTTVYIVTQGQYSDLSIEAVFTSKEKAQAFIDNEGDMNEWIEEFELDKKLRPLSTILTPCMEKNGDVRIVLKRRGKPDDVTLTRFGIDYYNKKNHYLICDVVTDDEERAIKVANERRTMLIANGEWPTSGGT